MQVAKQDLRPVGILTQLEPGESSRHHRHGCRRLPVQPPEQRWIAWSASYRATNRQQRQIRIRQHEDTPDINAHPCFFAQLRGRPKPHTYRLRTLHDMTSREHPPRRHKITTAPGAFAMGADGHDLSKAIS
jgi:hypothetical protein